MFHIVLCDDDPKDRRILREAVLRVPGCRRAGDLTLTEYTSGEQLLFEMAEGAAEADLIFLDIYMSGISGMEAAGKLRAGGIKTPIVFLTTSPDFALESYDVEAFGYLLKPVDEKKLEALIEKLEVLQRAEKYYIYRRGAKTRRISHSQIVFAESLDHKLLIHLTDGDTLEVTGKINQLQEALDSDCFLRCHQSYLVNMNHISGVGDSFVMDDGHTAAIRKKDRKAICDRYHSWLLKEVF